MRNVNSGHPGSITSVHATSAELAFEQLVLLVKQNPGGRDLARADIKSLLYLLVDVVMQFGVEHHERFIKEIWFEPERKHRAERGAAGLAGAAGELWCRAGPPVGRALPGSRCLAALPTLAAGGGAAGRCSRAARRRPPVAVHLGAGLSMALRWSVGLLAGAGAGLGAARSMAASDTTPSGTNVERSSKHRRGRPPRARQMRDAAITLAGCEIPALDETKHFKLIGTTGTGKSTAIREILSSALARGDRAVIADPDGGYLQALLPARARRRDP